MSITDTIKADEAKVKAAVQADLAKAESFIKTEESATFSGKVLAIVAGITFVLGFIVAKVL